MGFMSVSTSYRLHLNIPLPLINLSTPLKERFPIPVVNVLVLLFHQVLANLF